MTGLTTELGKPRATWTPLDLAQLLSLAGRNWRLPMLSGLAGVAVMLGVLVVLGPRYDVTAKILVRLGREMTAPLGLGTRDAAQLMPVSMRPEAIATEVEILSNPRLITRVVDYFGEDFFADSPPVTLWQRVKSVPKAAMRAVRTGLREGMVLLGLRPATTPLERLTLAVGAGLQVEAVRRSDVIQLQFSFPDPHAGVLLLDKYIEFALGSHIQTHRVPRVRAFFAAERAARSAELREAEERLLAARTKRNAAWSAPEQQALLMRTGADLQLQQAQALAEAAQAAAEVEHLRGALGGMPSSVTMSSMQARNRTPDELRNRRLQVELELAGLRARYAEGSPEVGDLRRQLGALDASIAAEPEYRVESVTTGANPQRDGLARELVARQTQLEGHRARAGQLAEQLAQAREQLQQAQRTEIEIDQVQREVQRLRRSVDLYEKSLDDANIAEALEGAELSNLQVLMPPTADLLPSAPSVRRFLLIGLLGGVTLGIGVVVLREMLGGRRWPRRAAADDAGPIEPALTTVPDRRG